MPAVVDRDVIVATRRRRLAGLGEIMKARPLTPREASAWRDLVRWNSRYLASRRSRLPGLIDAAIRRVAAAERRLMLEADGRAARAVIEAKARLDRFRREQGELVHG